MIKTPSPIWKWKLGQYKHFRKFLSQCKMKKILRKFLAKVIPLGPLCTAYCRILYLWILKYFMKRVKRFMSIYCKRRGADGSFSIPHLMHFCILTFHLFWVNTPLCQGRAALLCSKIARQISHENEWFEIYFLHFCDSFLNRHIFYY